jgi:hypothetical protein
MAGGPPTNPVLAAPQPLRVRARCRRAASCSIALRRVNRNPIVGERALELSCEVMSRPAGQVRPAGAPGRGVLGGGLLGRAAGAGGHGRRSRTPSHVT